MGGKDGPHEAPCLRPLPVAAPAPEASAGEGEQGSPRYYRAVVAACALPLHRPALRDVPIALVRGDRVAGVDRAVEGGSVSKGVQETLLEGAKGPVEDPVSAEGVDRAPIVVERAPGGGRSAEAASG